MKKLAERAYRVVWLNPLLGRAGYAPAARGMAAALAHVDDFLPIHDLRSIHELAARLASLPRRKATARSAQRVRSGAEVPR